MAIKNGKSSPLIQALDRMSYEYLSTNAPDLIVAIDQELREGLTPAEIRFRVQRTSGLTAKGWRYAANRQHAISRQ